MFEVRILEKPAFTVLGRKAWMPLQKPEDFGLLLQESSESGLIEKLIGFNGGKAGTVTNSVFLGIAVTPKGGSMDYYIATEISADVQDGEFESFTVPASRWAIIQGKSASLEEISKMEQYGYCEWLPVSCCELADTPQMNVFISEGNREYTELWLPIVK